MAAITRVILCVVACLACGEQSFTRSAVAGMRTERAQYVITVTDDFVVNVYHNGKLVPDSKRELVLDHFGATVERININVQKGDWLVFNVVNNRLRWGGAYYFAVAGCFEKNEFGFVSQLGTGDWSVCDNLREVDAFIATKSHLVHHAAKQVAQPWHEGTKLMRQHAGDAWQGSPLWGVEKNTWIKVVVD